MFVQKINFTYFLKKINQNQLFEGTQKQFTLTSHTLCTVFFGFVYIIMYYFLYTSIFSLYVKYIDTIPNKQTALKSCWSNRTVKELQMCKTFANIV